MNSGIMGSWVIDPGYIIIALVVTTIILTIGIVLLILRFKKLDRSYDYFMRGKAAENLEDTIIALMEEIKDLRAEDRSNKDAIRLLNKNQRASYQKMGMVKYNAFKGMGGNLSFALAILDYTNTGIVLNAVHSREGCYMYIKQVDRGQTEVLLGSEEKEALEQALGY